MFHTAFNPPKLTALSEQILSLSQGKSKNKFLKFISDLFGGKSEKKILKGMADQLENTVKNRKK